MKYEYIRSVMDKLQAVLEVSYPGIKIELGDQNVDTPEYPFGSYKILVLNQDPTKSASSWIEATSAEDFKQAFRKNQTASISLAFLHNSSISTCWDLCQMAVDWFDSIQGMTECEKFGITPQLITGDVQDRTTVLESTQYEYKAGFDVMFRSRKFNETQGKTTASAPSVEFQEEA
ncbi:phage neck terminator protein [Leptospira noguchii]|uniref:Phage neck terminator protein gp12-like domain-containing protein n=1 Tax=Leptospira noguchii serovar Panama str. CZ214 TaxID=1001595 RepID=T0GMB3_9LEPT|nr:hypothetical protein [Leptospira noguchii]EQA70027.1 hypothetical protein LEP1GSC059_2365 [Leptospira noguchii serovar Panama str. CZ214]EQA70251.1 hypothetical protein LEP1GSC059_0697 [Leptospira noguchii serovar Panama str. CZ214]EQA72399.1 hypothetical protein LEP1GSC059_3662 [Leptospira noguchii serovar Panama str. CZ214]EQA72559.1 hypothetical protein LEP1GSC059_3192 [Leptospira noguchii serovar Panama str. CZ214]